MTITQPRGADIKIVERVGAGESRPDFVVPSELRINGVPVLVPAGPAIKIDPLATDPEGLVRVTLTVIARRVSIGQESEDDRAADRAAAKCDLAELIDLATNSETNKVNVWKLADSIVDSGWRPQRTSDPL